MTKFTIEDLRDIAYRGSYDDLERELALQLLASMEQTPVYLRPFGGDGETFVACDGNDERAITLYAAPQLPQPAVVDEIDVNDPALDTHRKWMAEGWNSCRAAMLQAGNHTEQHLDMVGHPGDANENVDCRLPFYQWLSKQNEPIDVDCGCVTTEAFYHWLRVAYEAGNSPVTLDGYVLVPKEMTDEIGEAIALQANCCGGIALDIYDAMLAAAPQQELK